MIAIIKAFIGFLLTVLYVDDCAELCVGGYTGLCIDGGVKLCLVDCFGLCVDGSSVICCLDEYASIC